MEQNLKLQIIDEKFARLRYRKTALTLLGCVVATFGFVAAGYFVVQYYINSKLQAAPTSSPWTNATIANITDSEDCGGELKDEDYEDMESLSFAQIGWDKEGRAVWMLDVGRLDIRGIISKNEKNEEYLDYIGNVSVPQIMCSIKEANFPPGERALAIIIDFKDYSLWQFSSYTVLDITLKFMSKILPLLANAEYAWFLNLNFVANALVRLIRPTLEHVYERIIFENDKEVWTRQMREKIPLKYIPPKYGGFSNYTCPTRFCTFYRA